MTTTDGFFIGGLFQFVNRIDNYIQRDAKIVDLIKQDVNADRVLSVDDKQSYHTVWSGKASTVTKFDIHISK